MNDPFAVGAASPSRPATRIFVFVPDDVLSIEDQSRANPAGPKGPIPYARAVRCQNDCVLSIRTPENDRVDAVQFFRGDNSISVAQVYTSGTVIPDGDRLVALF